MEDIWFAIRGINHNTKYSLFDLAICTEKIMMEECPTCINDITLNSLLAKKEFQQLREGEKKR